MATFNVGDVVQLKSGGPKMTVHGNGHYDGNNLLCVWFDKDQKIQSGDFNPSALEAADVDGGESPRRQGSISV